MSNYFATVKWQRQNGEVFNDNKYSRAHIWKFNGGQTIQASSSPHVVPLPYSVEANVDPEEAFIASISSCHMLFFLSLASNQKFIIESYTDKASGILQPDENKNVAMTDVTLKPKIIFSGKKQPTKEQIDKIHHLAHKQCFIANSIKTKIIIQ